MVEDISPERRREIDTVKQVLASWLGVVDAGVLLTACMEVSIALHIGISDNKAEAIVGFEALKIGLERAILSSFDSNGQKIAPATHANPGGTN